MRLGPEEGHGDVRIKEGENFWIKHQLLPH